MKNVDNRDKLSLIVIVYIMYCNVLLGKLHSQDMMLRNMPNVALAIFILVESLRKDKKSFWYPYLTTLPMTYSTPVYFGVADIEALKGSPTFGIIFVVTSC